MGSTDTLEARIRRLEDRAEIGELIARYCFAMDNRDVKAIEELFTPDVVIRSADGVMNSEGLPAVVAMFLGRFKVLGPSHHVTHDRELTFSGSDADAARGLVSAHAEMNRNGMAMVAAIRYHDVYRRDRGRWRFGERSLSFFYYIPATEYVEALQEGLSRRMRAYDDRRPADWPEGLASWQEFYGTQAFGPSTR